jgi:hypothetical protein
VELFTPDETAAIEERLVADGAHLRALPLQRLGFYGGREKPLPVAVGNRFSGDSEDWYWEDQYRDNEPGREEDRRQAQILAGALWRGCAQLLEGLFDDLRAIGALEEEGGDVADFIENESTVMHGLPPAFAQDYDSYFVQRFLVVAADMTTKLAGTWTPPSCVAQELAVRCLVGVTDAYLDDVDVELEPGWGSHVFDALVEDADYEFLYDITSVGRREALLRMAHVDTVNLGFNSWFEPFGDRPMSAFVNPEPPTRPGPEPVEYPVDSEAYPGDARPAALDRGDLVGLEDYLEEGPFDCPVAITKEAWQALVCVADDPDSEQEAEREAQSVYRVIAAAAAAVQEEPDRISARFSMAPMEPADAEPVHLTLVAGPDGADGQHLTVQIAPREP